eukprot:7366358-Prymnesium_polylepis.1
MGAAGLHRLARPMARLLETVRLRAGQQRPGWAKRVRAAHRRLMQVVKDDPNAKAWRQAYVAALTQDAGGEQALREGGGQTNQLLSEEGFPLE